MNRVCGQGETTSTLLRGAHVCASEPGVEVLRAGGLSQALDEFVDNWKIHPGKLIGAIEVHQQMAAASADAYGHTDHEPAKELTQCSSFSGGARSAS